MAQVSLENIAKYYGKVDVLHDINLEINLGEFVVFVGPSGCGKSTLLRMIAGLEDITSGTLSIDGVVMNDVPPVQRGIAMVFQSYALYPHMTVRQNMEFSLKIAKMSKPEIKERVENAAKILQLEPYLNRLPKALSGGQRQRVAIGRAIVRNPKIFLFDEPLSNLDAALRVATRIEISKLSKDLPDSTMIYVTHDQVEAMTLADRIVILNNKGIEQVGAPLELYTKPRNLFVAQFIGSPKMNIFEVKLVQSGKTSTILLKDKKRNIPISTPSEDEGKNIYLGVRPEDCHICQQEESLFEGHCEFIENLGETTLIYLQKSELISYGDEPVISKLSGIEAIKRNSYHYFNASPDKWHLFNPDGINYQSLQ